MSKRPLCVFCFSFLAVRLLLSAVFGTGGSLPPALNTACENGEQILVEGTIRRIEIKENVTALLLRDSVVSIRDQKIKQSEILVYLRPKSKTEQLNIGYRILVRGDADLFDEARNPGNFDQRSYYLRQGIRFFVWGGSVEVRQRKTAFPGQLLYEFRSAWKKILIKYMGEYYGGTMSAVLLAEKSGLDSDMKRLWQKSGIGHILAVSGLHMSFLGIGIYRLLRKAGLPVSAAGTAGSAVLGIYVMMIGGGVSGVRALIMFLIRMGAEITGRDYDLPTSVFAAGALQCAWKPLLLPDAGFQLSYGAVLGMSLLYPPLYGLFCSGGKVSGKKKNAGNGAKILTHILRSAVSSLSVNAALMGPLLYFYFEFPVYSLLLNLFVIPAMPLLMAAGIAGSLTVLIWEPAGRVMFGLCRAVLKLYDSGCALTEHLPGNRLVTGRPEPVLLVLYYAVLAVSVFLYYRREGEQRKHLNQEGNRNLRAKAGPGLAVAAAALIMPLFCRWTQCCGSGLQVMMLDVGQGDGILIRTEEGKNYFVDGGSSDVDSVGIYRIEPCLLSLGIGELDAVFLSHGDEDHVNGIRELADCQDTGVRIRNLILPPEQFQNDTLQELASDMRETGTNVSVMKQGDEIRQGKTEILCLAPLEQLAEEPGSNGASMVLRVSYGSFSILLTGDLEGKGEEELLSSGLCNRCTILKAAHHGSRNSGSEAFLEQTAPKAALISAGQENRYGHPHEETLKRLQDCGCSIYSTQTYGAVTVWTDGEKVRICHFRMSGE